MPWVFALLLIGFGDFYTIAIALTVWLLYISNYMGKTFDEYIGSGYIVGGDAEKEVETSDDTSCAIDDDSKSKDKDETAV